MTRLDSSGLVEVMQDSSLRGSTLEWRRSSRPDCKGMAGRYPDSSFEASASAVQRDRSVKEHTDLGLERRDLQAAEHLTVLREFR